MKRVHLIVRGKVQAVGFRWYCQQRAIQYHITGYAKNMPDGSVKVLAQGKAEAVDEYVGSIRRGPKTASVDSVEVEERIVIPDESGFTTS